MRWVLGFAMACAVFGPGAAQTFKVTVPPPAAVSPLPVDANPQPINLTRVAANIRPGTPWGEVTSGPFPLPCTRDRLLHWEEANNSIASAESFDRIFREELAAAGFRSSGDPTNLFETDATRSDLQLGALITDLRIRTCEVELPFGVQRSGSAAMDVEWQVYSVTRAKVLARINTQGGADMKGKELTAPQVLGGAFADNARRLLASDEFRRIVTSNAGGDVGPDLAPIVFSPGASGSAPLNAAVNGVVSVFAGTGHGSGVLISSDGYVLTNHHVAGETGRVRIRWADGTESVGDVVRGDRRRDVALIRTTAKAVPLSIRASPALLGETVFAVGTPLDKELAGTLTRGVVSSNRVLEGQPWIQSDVAVTQGNSGGPLLDEKGAVIGLTSWGMAPNGASVGLNFFIPIEDALRVLALKPAN